MLGASSRALCSTLVAVICVPAAASQHLWQSIQSPRNPGHYPQCCTCSLHISSLTLVVLHFTESPPPMLNLLRAIHQVTIRACTGDASQPIIVDVNNLQQQIYVYGEMRWEGNIKFVNSFPRSGAPGCSRSSASCQWNRMASLASRCALRVLRIVVASTGAECIAH